MSNDAAARASSQLAALAPPAPARPSTAAPIQLTVNGALHTVPASPDTPLLYVLRDELLLQGPRFGCGLRSEARSKRT